MEREGGGVNESLEGDGSEEKHTLDDFLLDAAITLDVTQKQIEQEFYMLDVVRAVQKRLESDAKQNLVHLQIRQARHMEKADYKEFIKNLQDAAGIKQKAESFDRKSMDALHAFTKKQQ